MTLSPEPYYQFTVSGPTVYYPGLYIDLDVTSEMSDGTPVPGTFKARSPQ